VSRLLTSAGAEVVTASSADAALERLERERPDVLVAEIGPSDDSHALIGRIRTREAKTGVQGLPAVALSADTGHDAQARWLAGGYDAHVRKPIEPAALINAVRALLDRSAGEVAT
jgi:CheY-like chemotaxis protein